MSMSVANAKYFVRYAAQEPLDEDAGWVLAREVDRLEAQLDSVRAELAATAARMAAWDEALDACLPALHDQMTPTRRLYYLQPDTLEDDA